MTEQSFVLRKGHVIEKTSSTLYLIRDDFNNNEIVVSISAKQFIDGFSLELEESVYVVVSPLDLMRGRIFTSTDEKAEYANKLFADKDLIDKGVDPLAQSLPPSSS